MTRRWRIAPREERWMAVASRMEAPSARTVAAERAGGWRSTGPLARIALFLLGLVAGALLLGILGFRSDTTLLLGGLVAALAAEWLIVTKRLFASGIEEGLCLAGFLLIGAWVTTLMTPHSAFAADDVATLVLITAAGAAGLRLLNPLVTTCAVIAFVFWVGSTDVARVIDQAIGRGMTCLIAGCSLATLALVLGAREYHRPSHDRMFDWLVATLPVAAYAPAITWASPGAFVDTGASSSRPVTAALLIALGAAMLVTGLRRRRHAPLLGFMGCVACLGVELRLAAGFATEAWLLGYGLVALAAGVALDRYLREPRRGLTSMSLTSQEGALDLLQTAGAAVLSQHSATVAPQPEAAVTGGGGRFGGGGASGSF